jgi:hypothetical protein
MFDPFPAVKDTRSTGAKNVLEEAARLGKRESLILKRSLIYSLVSNEYVVHVKKLLRDAALDRMKLEKEKVRSYTVLPSDIYNNVRETKQP